MLKFLQFHSASDSKIDICSITLQISRGAVQFKYFWKYLTRLVEAADICRCVRRGAAASKMASQTHHTYAICN